MTNELFAYLWGGLFILIFINLAFLLYVAYAKLEKIEKYLKNSAEVMTQKNIWGGGPIGRVMRLTKVGAILARPNFYQRHKLASIEDIEKIPGPLKAWILTPCRITVCLCIFMFGLWAWEELIKRL